MHPAKFWIGIALFTFGTPIAGLLWVFWLHLQGER